MCFLSLCPIGSKFSPNRWCVCQQVVKHPPKKVQRSGRCNHTPFEDRSLVEDVKFGCLVVLDFCMGCGGFWWGRNFWSNGCSLWAEVWSLNIVSWGTNWRLLKHSIHVFEMFENLKLCWDILLARCLLNISSFHTSFTMGLRSMMHQW